MGETPGGARVSTMDRLAEFVNVVDAVAVLSVDTGSEVELFTDAAVLKEVPLSPASDVVRTTTRKVSELPDATVAALKVADCEFGVTSVSAPNPSGLVSGAVTVLSKLKPGRVGTSVGVTFWGVEGPWL